MSITFSAVTMDGRTVESPLQAFHFPGGEAHIKGAEDTTTYIYQTADMRGASADDLIMLAMWASAVESRGEPKVLLLPYLPGARADRGVPFGANIYAQMINQLHADHVVTLDPHSPVMPGLIENLTVFPVSRIIKREVQRADSDSRPQPYVGVIAPDKGAVERAGAAGRAMGVPVYRAEKSRDFETGKLSGYRLVDALPETGKLLVVDDICDGGGTFQLLADAAQVDPGRLDLWVSHGIFSKGYSGLLSRFGHIYTTDSWQGPNFGATLEEPPVSVTVIPVRPYLTTGLGL